MNRSRSAQLAAWGCAWLAGATSPDELLRAVTAGDGPHVLADSAPLTDLLRVWRGTGHAPRVVFPVPGDVRGLPGPATFRTAALDAGEAVVCGRVGLVPEVHRNLPSSAAPTVRWSLVTVQDVHPDPLAVEQAQHELTDAIRDTASELATLDLAGRRDVREALAGARRAGERLDLPPGFPPRAVALIAQAERLTAVLGIAAADPAGGAVDRHGMAARAEHLRDAGALATAVRRARQAGYNAGWRPVAPHDRPTPDPLRIAGNDLR